MPIVWNLLGALAGVFIFREAVRWTYTIGDIIYEYEFEERPELSELGDLPTVLVIGQGIWMGYVIRRVAHAFIAALPTWNVFSSYAP